MPQHEPRIPIKEAAADDPMELVGVSLEEDPDDEALAEMARSFVEEFGRMGWTGDQILRMFRSPFFRVPHRILEVKGEEFVQGLVSGVDALRNQLQQEMGARS